MNWIDIVVLIIAIIIVILLIIYFVIKRIRKENPLSECDCCKTNAKHKKSNLVRQYNKKYNKKI